MLFSARSYLDCVKIPNQARVLCAGGISPAALDDAHILDIGAMTWLPVEVIYGHCITLLRIISLEFSARGRESQFLARLPSVGRQNLRLSE